MFAFDDKVVERWRQRAPIPASGAKAGAVRSKYRWQGRITIDHSSFHHAGAPRAISPFSVEVGL
jgi:hypothetical protein